MNLGSEEFEVQFFLELGLGVRPISGPTGSKFGLFGGVRIGLKFGFPRQTWIQVSLKFDLSSSKQFEVHYFWVRSNTSSYHIRYIHTMYKGVDKWSI